MSIAGNCLAEKPAKAYPENGKVIGNGTTGQSVGQTTVYTHTYKVETDKVVFLLDCGKRPFFGRTGAECGGDKKIQIGDTLTFRIQKAWVYIPVVDGGVPGEQKLRILSQELRPEPAANKQ